MHYISYCIFETKCYTAIAELPVTGPGRKAKSKWIKGYKRKGSTFMIHLLQKLDRAIASPPCWGAWMIVRLLPTAGSGKPQSHIGPLKFQTPSWSCLFVIPEHAGSHADQAVHSV